MMNCMNFLASLEEFDKNDLVKVGYENPLKPLGLKDRDVQVHDLPKIAYERHEFRLEKS